MTATFNLEYRTNWGETLYLTGSSEALGSWNPTHAIPMNYTRDGQWTLSVEMPSEATFEYGYFVGENNSPITREWGNPRKIAPAKNKDLLIFDQWQGQPADKTFFSSAFTKDILFHQDKKQIPAKGIHILTIRCFAPTLRQNQSLAICGNIPALGEWNPENAVAMDGNNFPEWQIALDIDKITFPLEYKFVVTDAVSGTVIGWENGANRILEDPKAEKNENIILSGLYLNNPLPNWKGAGVAIPVFSLRSEEGFGIGEFTDLKKMVDWAVATGQQFIQILPINDTTMTHTWVDSYPYNANSIFALHPAYINLTATGVLGDPKKMKKYEAERAELNSLDKIDYERVTAAKWSYLSELFAQKGKSTLESAEFKAFFEKNREWLIPYAAFCYLRDQNETPAFNWWKDYSDYNKEEIEQLCAPSSEHYEAIAIHYFIQYHLHLQLQEVRNYAHQHGVVLKGDIPIGISRDSVDAWSENHLFNMSSQAGAPPDDFSKNGQNWGFPTYNWNEMRKDNYAWWKKRFTKMADYFDAYRIDHILGFFRIWEIPEKCVQGLLGHFSPALPFSPQDMTLFDFRFNHDRHATPYIRRYFLNDLFGEYTDEVIQSYLEKGPDDTYTLQKEFDTQAEIANYFIGQNDDKSKRIKEGLMELTGEVLFIQDPYDQSKYHPRISAQYTYSYRGLNNPERDAFNRLYDDFFYRRHNEYWKHEAMTKLPALISSTDMMVCGEDLGMIPHCVPEVMEQLQILSLEIQRMPKDAHRQFGDPAHYPYLSVCTTSTHDMSTLRGWWEEDRGATQRFYNDILGEEGQAPYFAEPWVCEKIVDQHLASPSMLMILPLQDWLSIDGKLRRENPTDERINIPAIPRHYWRYRMHLTLEELLKANDFNKRIREKINGANRHS